jgi:hypothetical protein
MTIEPAAGFFIVHALRASSQTPPITDPLSYQKIRRVNTKRLWIAQKNLRHLLIYPQPWGQLGVPDTLGHGHRVGLRQMSPS